MSRACGSRIMRTPDFIRLVAAFLLALVCPLVAAANCAVDFVDIRTEQSSLRFRVEVADTPESRAQGLMFRESMPRFSGMLFVYEAPGPVAFWMRNTLIPLDMLFFDPSGLLTHVHANARPLDETPIPGGENVLYVLEINGGLAETLGIAEGAVLRHPAIDPAQAAWSCAAE